MEKGSLLLDRYEVMETLGEGGFSRVVRALDTKMDREVAVKVIAASRQAAVRALREAKTVALLNHPNIVTLHEFEERDNRYYLIMELVRGRSLADILDDYERLPAEMAMAVAISVCEALDCAHANDVIHRDIKPANLRIVEEDGRIKVMDFGIARLKSAAKTSGVTTEGDIVGTFAYMSPEQSGGEQIDERSDIFSMGVLMYKMATGRLPFEADTPAGTIYKIINVDPVPPIDLRPDIPPAFSQIILKALAKSPDKRFRSAGELKTAVEHCRQSEEAPAAVIKEGLGRLTPRKIEGLEDITAMRGRLRAWVREYRETITVTGYAAGCAAVAAWTNAYLPSFETSLKVAAPILVFFSALFVPPLGLAAVLGLISAGLWQISVYVGAAAIVISVLYWFVLGRAFPEFAALPLLTPGLAWLQIPFLFPLALGIAFGPIMAGFLAGSGALVLAAAELNGLDYGWMIAARPEALTAAVRFSGEASDVSVFGSYFTDQPWLLAQVAVWAGVAALISVVRTENRKYSYWLAGVVGIIGIWAGYQLAADAVAFKLDAEAVLIRPLILSVLVFLVLMFIFVHPPRRSS